MADLRVVAGEHSLTTVSGYEQAIPVQSYIMHPDYDPRTNANDIALLKVGYLFLFVENIFKNRLTISFIAENSARL